MTEHQELLAEINRLRAELEEAREQRSAEVSRATSLVEQRAAEEQVRLAERLEAASLVAGGIAHDVNNAVQVVRGFTHLALGQLGESHPAREPLERVLEASARLELITPQLAALGRRAPVFKTTLDLNKLVADTEPMLARLLGGAIELVVQPGPSPAPLVGDPAQLERALVSLCLHAREGLPAGGTVTVRVDSVEVEPALRRRHPWLAPGRSVRLVVEDSGPPLSADALERVFEPYFSARGGAPAADFGLALVHATVRNHDGAIFAASGPERGTRFEMLLPAAGEAGPTTPRADGARALVLLAEDEPLVRALTQRILEGAGYAVVSAPNGSEACKLFLEHKEEIALVILDLVMPAMGGFEAFELMSAMRPDVRVLFVSGFHDQAFASHAVQPPGTDLLLKPFQSEQLLLRVRRVLGGETGERPRG